jgi:hypothetical protein
MFTSLRGWLVAGVATILIGGVLASTSHAAPPRGFRPLPNSTTFVNPNWQVAPGLSLNQYAYNQRIIANTVSRYPAWAYGYNPYPAPVIYTTPMYNPYYSAFSPYAFSPYYVNPYYGY